jgi:hypothetical protein
VPEYKRTKWVKVDEVTFTFLSPYFHPLRDEFIMMIEKKQEKNKLSRVKVGEGKVKVKPFTFTHSTYWKSM